MRATRRNALNMGQCPRCNGDVTREEHGKIGLMPDRGLRAEDFWACNFCEWVEEIVMR